MPSLDAFDLSSLNPAQRDLITTAVRRCTFDFTRCLPRLKAEKNRDRIPVTFEDLSRYSEAMPSEDGHEHVHSHAEGSEYHVVILRRRVLGLAWYSGKITIEQSLVNEPLLCQEVFLAEAAHMVDFFVITDNQRRAIFELFHGGTVPEHGHGWFEETGNNDYWSWVGESWMGAFIRAYSDIEPWDNGFMHRLDEAQSQAILPVLDPPPPPPPTPSAPETLNKYFASRKGHTYHDSHKGVGQHRWFATPAEARAAGLTACSTCRPR